MNKPLQRLLALDTSTSSMTAALLEGERLLAETAAIAERNHSMYLVPSVLDMLASAGAAMQDVDGIGVGKGPGSYTGVRIGVTVAKTLAWSLNVPVIGVSSLEALALGASAGADGVALVIPMMDARRGNVYTGLYEVRNGISRCLLPDGNRPLAQWLDSLSGHVAETSSGACPIRFVGDTAPFRETLQAWAERDGGSSAVIVESAIRACEIGRLAARRWMIGERDDVHALAPNYTQLAEAEAKYLAREQR